MFDVCWLRWTDSFEWLCAALGDMELHGSHVTRATPAPNQCRNIKMYLNAWPALIWLFDQETYHEREE